MKRVVAFALFAVLAAAVWVWADVEIHVGGSGSGDIFIEEVFRTEYGTIRETFEAVDATYGFHKYVNTWTAGDVSGFDEVKYIWVEGEFDFSERVWAFDPVLDHYELGVFTGFGGVGQLEFEKLVTVAYDYGIWDSWLDQEVYVGGFFEEGYVYVDHMAHEIEHRAEQDYEFHVWADSGSDSVFQSAMVEYGEMVVFGVGVDFISESFGVHSLIYDYGW